MVSPLGYDGAGGKRGGLFVHEEARKRVALLSRYYNDRIVGFETLGRIQWTSCMGVQWLYSLYLRREEVWLMRNRYFMFSFLLSARCFLGWGPMQAGSTGIELLLIIHTLLPLAIRYLHIHRSILHAIPLLRSYVFFPTQRSFTSVDSI